MYINNEVLDTYCEIRSKKCMNRRIYSTYFATNLNRKINQPMITMYEYLQHSHFSGMKFHSEFILLRQKSNLITVGT